MADSSDPLVDQPIIRAQVPPPPAGSGRPRDLVDQPGGGKATVFMTGAFNPGWSPDGKVVALVRAQAIAFQGAARP